MRVLALGGFVLVVVVVGLRAEPGVVLPKPPGPFGIGVRHLELVDRSRSEPFSRDASTRREVTVRVWYPATPRSGSGPATYLPGAEKVQGLFGLPPAVASLATHAERDAVLSGAGGPLPVLLFNHGWGEHFAQNTMLMEALASSGYVVFSVAHHFEAKYSVRPDGRPVLLDGASPRFQQIMREQQNPEAPKLFGKMASARSDADRLEVCRATTAMLPTVLVESTRLWVQDIRFVIDEVARLDRSDPVFRARLDLGRIGVLGMSLGGLAAAEACVADRRLKAGASLDGGVYGDLIDHRVAQPFLFVSGNRYLGFESWFLDRVDRVGAAATVRGADHYDFHDATVLDRQHPMLGTIDGRHMAALLNDVVLAFFDDTLGTRRPTRFSATVRRYPEIVLQSKGL